MLLIPLLSGAGSQVLAAPPAAERMEAEAVDAAVNTLCYAVADDGDRLVTINRITGGDFTDIGAVGRTA